MSYEIIEAKVEKYFTYELAIFLYFKILLTNFIDN
tara:strand:- start:351 stop:455 length:105 start_codon:yes stop_codon:yes gene_type:complete